MGPKKYTVQLTDDERQTFKELISKGKSAVWKLKRAQVLLKSDQSENAPAWTDEQIAEAFEVTVRSVENWRKQAVLQGPMSLMERKQRMTPPTAPKLDGEREAQLVALSCSTPPMGASQWSLRLLANKLVELNIVDAISHETVRGVLKKRNQTLAKGSVVHSA